MNNVSEIRRAIAASVCAIDDFYVKRLGRGPNKNPYNNGTDPISRLDRLESDPSWLFVGFTDRALPGGRGTERVEINGQELDLPVEIVFFPLFPDVSDIADDEDAANYVVLHNTVHLAKFYRIEDRQTQMLFRLQYGEAA
ncbi:hypothetical protein [Shinella oryzae]|uniref:hypothetical protein n=1 Tax=Shinella oryzae TaxID=2871820 RepID=UPI001FF32D7E|nr:hypothetical protein [Shinella oryzae]UPA25354.1 hypothetical protein K6301_03890 [Shinella oryzae]